MTGSTLSKIKERRDFLHLDHEHTAVADFEKGNIRLSDVLKELEINYNT